MTIVGQVAEDLAGWPPGVAFDLAEQALALRPDDAEAALVVQVTRSPAWFMEARCSSAAGDIVVTLTGGPEHVAWCASSHGAALVSLLQITDNGLEPAAPATGPGPVGAPEGAPEAAEAVAGGWSVVDLRTSWVEPDGWVEHRAVLLRAVDRWFVAVPEGTLEGGLDLEELEDLIDVLVPACGTAGIPPVVCGFVADAFTTLEPA